MAETRRWLHYFGTVLVCLAVAAASYWGVVWILTGATGNFELGPVVFDEAILQEPDPFVADIKAASQLVRERWSYAEHRRRISGVNIEALTAEALQALGDTPNDAAFRRAITQFTAGLCDGHADVLFKERSKQEQYRWPFTLRHVKEGYLIEAVWPAAQGVHRGDLLLEVGGRSIDECVEDAERFVFASTKGARRRRALEHVARSQLIPAQRFRIRRITEAPGGNAVADVVQLELECPRSFHSIPAAEPVAAAAVVTSATSLRTWHHETLADGIAYLRPGNFSPPKNSGWPGPPEGRDAILADSYAEMDRIVGELAAAGARALVLDLRGNPGGTDLLGQFLVDRLVQPGYVYLQLSSQLPSGWRGFSEFGSNAPAGKHALRVPTVCLTDEFTFSTADNVAACLADVHPDIQFVGRPNGAGSGAPRWFTLPRTGTRIRFCTQRVRSPKGRMVEGNSVPLDVAVEWTRDDVLLGRDPDLAAALQLLRK